MTLMGKVKQEALCSQQMLSAMKDGAKTIGQVSLVPVGKEATRNQYIVYSCSYSLI